MLAQSLLESGQVGVWVLQAVLVSDAAAVCGLVGEPDCRMPLIKAAISPTFKPDGRLSSQDDSRLEDLQDILSTWRWRKLLSLLENIIWCASGKNISLLMSAQLRVVGYHMSGQLV